MNGLQQQSAIARSRAQGVRPRETQHNTIMDLQRAIGNQSVQRLIRSGNLSKLDNLPGIGDKDDIDNEIQVGGARPEAGLTSEPSSSSPPRTEAILDSGAEKPKPIEKAITPTTTTTTTARNITPSPKPSAAAQPEAPIAAAAAPSAKPTPPAAPQEEAAAIEDVMPSVEEEGAMPEKEVASMAKAEGEKKEEGEEEAEAPSPSPYEAIGPAIQAVNQRTRGLAKHSEPTVLVGSAQAAALDKNTEQTRSAAAQTVVNIDEVKDQTKTVQRNEFKGKLKKAIDAATPKPKTESDAENVMKSGAKVASNTMRGQMASERDAAVGPLKTVANVEAAPSSQPAPEARSLEQEPLGKPPEPVSPEAVVPAPLPDKRLDYSSDREPTESVMSEAGVTQQQLEKGNEPEFQQSLEARSEAEQHEAQVTSQYRESEASIQDDTRKGAGTKLALDLGGMHGTRTSNIGQVTTQQLETKSKEALERQRITNEITRIKNSTKEDVEKILTSMETEAGNIFEAGLARAEKVYADTFEEAKGGVGTWLTTWGEDWEKLIEESLTTARSAYLNEVDIAIDKVADLVDKKLEEAKQRVARGRKEVDDYVGSLDANSRQFGVDAQKEVSKEFDAMEGEIDQRRDKLVDKLAEQYKASYERMSAMEEKLREENKSLWQRVYDATVGLVKKILAFKDMLLSVLSKAADVINDIISDPIGFLGNLVSGIMQGLNNFTSNIGKHLKKGLIDWLLGALAGAGLELPDTFDLKGIISILLQIFGLTYANFRSRAVKIVGEPTVAAIEKTAEIFRVIATEGVPGIGRLIMEKLEDLKSMVLDAIFDFIKEKVIMAGITWIIGLLNPASAFFKAIKAIYDIVMFIINRGSQIVEFVNAVIDSIGAIAKGQLSVAATFVENALAKAVPVAIGFLAGLLGVGDPSKPVRNIMEKAQAPVNKAIDWVINKAVSLVKSIGGLFGGKKKEDKISETNDPEHDAKIQAGLLDIDQEEQKYIADGRISRENAEKVAITIKKKHTVFKSISIIEAADKWNYHYVGSEGTKEGELKEAEPASLEIKKASIDDKKEIENLIRDGDRLWGLGPYVTHSQLSDLKIVTGLFERRITELITSGAIPEVEEEFARAEGAGLELGPWQGQRVIRGKNRALAKYRKPDVFREVLREGSVVEVHALEITLARDLKKEKRSASKDRGGRKDSLRKAVQMVDTMAKMKEHYNRTKKAIKQSNIEIIFVYHLFTPAPDPNSKEEKNNIAFLKEYIENNKSPSNVRIIWYQI